MKWIGQHIYDQISRFRDDVYLEDLSTTTETSVLVVDSTGKVSKSTTLADDIIEAEIDTLPGLISIGTDDVNLSILSDQIIWNNTTAHKPDLQMSNTADDATGAIISLSNRRGGASIQAGEDDDVLGTIRFRGYDDGGTPGETSFALIQTEIHDATSGQESGRLSFYVANHDGGAGAGLILTGGSENNEVDVTLGLGANSRVIIPGDIDLAGDMDVDGALTIGGTNVLTGSLITTLGTISEGIVITDTTTSSATQGGSLKLVADDDGVLADNHRLGVIEFQSREIGSGGVGYSATGNIQTGARIQAIADATWSTTENGASLEFYTTDGNASERLGLTLDSNLLATFAGGVTVTGTITGDVTGDITGNADTATTLATTRAINGVNFNGSAAITIPTNRVFGAKVKLLPNDFMPNEDGGTGKGMFLDDTAPTGLKPGIAAMELIAIADIPERFKATHVDVYSAQDLVIQAYEMDLDASGITSRSSAGNANTTLALTAAVNATDSNFLAIIVTTTAVTERVWGGTVTIAPQ